MKQLEQARDLLRLAVRQQADVDVIDRKDGGPAIRIKRGPHRAVLVPRRPEEAPEPKGELLLLDHAAPVERDRLRATGVNFVDLAGHVHLNLPFIVVDKERLQPTVQAQRPGFSASTLKVIHTLLAWSGDGTWSTRALAGSAGVSPATVSRAARELGALGLVVDAHPGARTRSEIRVPDKGRLLLAWADRGHWARHPRVDLMAPIGPLDRWVKELRSRLDVRWALTLHAGAGLWAPHAVSEEVHLYVDVPANDGLRRLAVLLDAVPSDRGNLHLLRPLDPTVVWERIEPRKEVPVVEPHRLVVDLWHHPLRGREQAEHLIDTVLRPRWGET